MHSPRRASPRSTAAKSLAFACALCLSIAAQAASAQRLTPNSSQAQARTTQLLQTASDLRAGGCQGRSGVRAPLRSDIQLEAAVRRWALGTPLGAALEAAGYRDEASSAVHVLGNAQSLRQALEHKLCIPLTDARYRDIGVLQQGRDSWVILAAPFTAPPASSAAQTAALVVEQIDRARSAPRRCGARLFPSAPPLRVDRRLTRAAAAHANDMLARDYFEHAGVDGSTPASRVAATGYRYRIVGENIAFGPENVTQAVQGWLQSPSHCENIMDPRFSETGVAFAASVRGAARIYWVEEFAAPR
jgi:uncharacterized protein YkwD